MGAKHPVPDNDTNGSRREIVAKLFKQMRSGKLKRAEQREKMKACAEEAARGTPADSAIFRMRAEEEEDESQQSGVRAIPDVNERLKLRRDQFARTCVQQREGLNRLKKTTMQAVQTVRETTLYSPEELKARLEEEEVHEPNSVDDADAGIVS